MLHIAKNSTNRLCLTLSERSDGTQWSVEIRSVQTGEVKTLAAPADHSAGTLRYNELRVTEGAPEDLSAADPTVSLAPGWYSYRAYDASGVLEVGRLLVSDAAGSVPTWAPAETAPVVWTS